MSLLGNPVVLASLTFLTDVSVWKQLGVALRYVKDGHAREKLIEFVACESITGARICKSLLDTLVRFSLDPKLCQAQGYDGASNMSGKFNGCQALFLEEAPQAGYFHCGSHKLNLVLSKSASVQLIPSMVCDMKSLVIFFKYSPKRQRALEKAIEDINKDRSDSERISQQKLKLLCDGWNVTSRLKICWLSTSHFWHSWNQWSPMLTKAGMPSPLWKQMAC